MGSCNEQFARYPSDPRRTRIGTVRGSGSSHTGRRASTSHVVSRGCVPIVIGPSNDILMSYDNSTESTDINVPTDMQKEPLIWDGNDAKIKGLLFELGRYLQRNSILQTYFAHRAVLLSNGKVAVPSISSIPFIMGDLEDSHGADIVVHNFTKPCPAIAERVAAAHAGRAARGQSAFSMPTTVPDHIVINPLKVQEADGKVLTILNLVFGHADQSEDLIDAADGSGSLLLAALNARAANASVADKAIVASAFDSIKSKGVTGELTVASLKTMTKAYKRAKRDLDPAQHPSAETEVQMVDLVAFKDVSVRDTYEVKCSASPPTTLDAAVTVLNGILTTRLRSEQLLASESDSPSSLLAKSTKVPAIPASAPSTSADALIAALIAKLGGVPDPNKDTPTSTKKDKGKGKDKDKDKDKGKVKIPRKDGKILKWVEGMGLCDCGIAGGKHLYRDCPKKDDEKSANLGEISAQTKAEIAAQVNAFLAGSIEISQEAGVAGVCELEDTETESSTDGGEKWCAAHYSLTAQHPSIAHPPAAPAHSAPAYPASADAIASYAYGGRLGTGCEGRGRCECEWGPRCECE